MKRRGGSLIALVTLAAGCATSTPATRTQHGHTTATVLGRPDGAIAGPQGRVAQFVVECGFSHAASDDPVVHPGMPGMSHLHDFFGNTTTGARSTLATLRAGATTCGLQADRAAYWAPALLRDGRPLTPVKSTAYYRPGVGADPAAVQPYPAGLVMIAGSATATAAQPTEIVAWTCGTGSLREPLPPACPPLRNLRLLVTFPDCWDGARLDSADHVDHVAYSHAGRCPPGFPAAIPQLQFSIEYPVTGDPAGLALSSGDLVTAHADFLDAWDPAGLQAEVDGCLHRGVVCGVTSGRRSG